MYVCVCQINPSIRMHGYQGVIHSVLSKHAIHIFGVIVDLATVFTFFCSLLEKRNGASRLSAILSLNGVGTGILNLHRLSQNP